MNYNSEDVVKEDNFEWIKLSQISDVNILRNELIRLYDILDSIDSLPDMIHPTTLEGYIKYYNGVESRHKKRHECITSIDGYELSIKVPKEKIIVDNNNLREVVYREIGRLGYYTDLNHIDVSNVTDMSYLFNISGFNGNISKWDVSNVTHMGHMFEYSQFNGDISNWDVSNVTNSEYMFHNCSIIEEYKPNFM